MNEQLTKEKAKIEQEYMRLKHTNNADQLTEIQVRYSKTCLKRPLKRRPKKKFSEIDNRLMQVKSIAECSHGAFCNTFDLY